MRRRLQAEVVTLLPHVRRPRGHKLALVLAMAALAAGGCDLGDEGGADGAGSVREGGPLAGLGGASATSAPVPLGEPYSWGGTTLVNSGDEPATIERVELLAVPAGMRVLGMYALDGAGPGIGLGEGFEPTGPDFPGLVIRSGTSYDVVVGLQLEEPGRFLIPAARVHYRVGENRYQTVFNDAVRLCGPPETYPSCPVEARVRY